MEERTGGLGEGVNERECGKRVGRSWHSPRLRGENIGADGGFKMDTSVYLKHTGIPALLEKKTCATKKKTFFAVREREKVTKDFPLQQKGYGGFYFHPNWKKISLGPKGKKKITLFFIVGEGKKKR